MRTDILEEIPLLPDSFPGIEQVPANALYLMGCRSFGQFCGTIRSIADPEEFCPFCPTERARRKQGAEGETTGWRLLKNEYPHKDTRKMFLIVPKRHLIDLSKLEGCDWTEIGLLFEECRQRHRIEGGGMMVRFGDPHQNTGTVPHLHLNIIEPIPGKEYRPPFAKNEDEHAEDYRRMLGFRDELQKRGGFAWLFSSAGIEETQPKA